MGILSDFKKTWYYLRKNGWKAAYLAASERLWQYRQPPYCYRQPAAEALQKQRDTPVSGLRFSVVVPAYETKREHLTVLLDSLAGQTYPHWELVLADASGSGSVRETLLDWERGHLPLPGQDWTIRYCKLPQNAGIAENTNAGIAQASGDYIGLLDHDDFLTPDALFACAKAIEREKKAGRRPQALYSDEDKCDGEGNRFFSPHAKTDFNLDLLLTNNYICHFLVMESSLLKDLRLRPAYEGAQDYDLVLRATARGAHFVHVPEVLYHWRCHSGSTAQNPQSKMYAYEAGRRAVEDFCKGTGWNVAVSHLSHLGFYRVEYEGGIFAQRPDIGVVAGPLPDKKKLRSGIYGPDGEMLYAGLKKGFSGPMHRAVLQQDVYGADLRALEVRRELLPLLEKAGISDLSKAGEADIRRASLAFCKEVRQAGYRIYWDPQKICASAFGRITGFENDHRHSQL